MVAQWGSCTTRTTPADVPRETFFIDGGAAWLASGDEIPITTRRIHDKNTLELLEEIDLTKENER